MLVICTECRTLIEVRCPQCGGLATLSSPPIRKPNVVQEGLYICNRYDCWLRRPFGQYEGGISHAKHKNCPPTLRLELQQDKQPPEGAEMTTEETANLIVCEFQTLIRAVAEHIMELWAKQDADKKGVPQTPAKTAETRGSSDAPKDGTP